MAGLLLTGGASRRMGHDKASLIIDGTSLANRTAALLCEVVEPVLEVGPGHSRLPAVSEDPPGGGPLVALAAGAAALSARGHGGAAVAVATDLPRLATSLLRRLASHPSAASVVPLVDGRPQWLAARWSPSALVLAQRLVASGERRMAALSDEVEWLDEPQWAAQLVDVDTPAALDALGVSWRCGAGHEGE
ncbi:MAG: NTP transferase domain-containing protein [Actinobacteria bacterium]|nr:NTP transferase domain-containing protein [Actinomycetota bacterium]